MPGKSRVYVNGYQYSLPVTPDVWKFGVGGYQVRQRWLKDRRRLVLSADDVLTYRRILVALGLTIRLMGDVDVAIDPAHSLANRARQ